MPVLKNPFTWPSSKDVGSVYGQAIGDFNYDAKNDEFLINDGRGIRRIPAEMVTASKAFNPPWANTAQSINKNPVPQTNLGSVIENESYRHKLVAMRLRLREGESMPFQFFATALAGDKVFVFVVQDNQAVTLEDEAPLFPSDTLITQLRLLYK